MKDAPASTPTMIGRALRRRCPRCGTGGVFRTYSELNERCHGCGMLFEREPGFWVGAMVIVTIVTTVVFLAVFIGGMVLTAPDIPWGWILGLTMTANLAVPILGYSRSKLIWSAMDLSWHPLEADEVAAAWAAMAARETETAD